MRRRWNKCLQGYNNGAVAMKSKGRCLRVVCHETKKGQACVPVPY